MKFNVAQLLKATVGTTREYEIDDGISYVEDVPVSSNVVGRARFTRTPRGVLVAADLTLAASLTCSRCLEDLEYPLHLRFDEEFEPTVDVVTGIEIPGPEDELVFTIDANHILDLARAVREYALLGLPMQPLCRDDCLGLCPECGQNLNRGKCSCSNALVDSRLAVLAKLLEAGTLSTSADPDRAGDRRS
ncbi:MAG: DUF177 domain-containing protein [Chloroflexi bacterium]|nr:DUF177 domain-containing protein [Chloroflexota bacterium]